MREGLPPLKPIITARRQTAIGANLNDRLQPIKVRSQGESLNLLPLNPLEGDFEIV